MPELAPLRHFDFIGWDHGLSTFVPQPFCPAGCKYPFGPPDSLLPVVVPPPRPPAQCRANSPGELILEGVVSQQRTKERPSRREKGGALLRSCLLKRFLGPGGSRSKYRWLNAFSPRGSFQPTWSSLSSLDKIFFVS